MCHGIPNGTYKLAVVIPPVIPSLYRRRGSRHFINRPPYGRASTSDKDEEE
jgi:hypothetical protein